MIQLVADEARSFFDYDWDLQNTLRYRYRITANGQSYTSDWTVADLAVLPTHVQPEGGTENCSMKRTTEALPSLISRLQLAEREWNTIRKSHYHASLTFFLAKEKGREAFEGSQEEYELLDHHWDALFGAKYAVYEHLAIIDGVETLCLVSAERPCLATKYFAFSGGRLWASKVRLTKEQWAGLIRWELERDTAILDRATGSGGVDKSSSRRTRAISVEVRREVWRRDGGRCALCGSQERLEFDHIIPVAMGGSDTVRNVQLLCEGCNRSKGATLG